MKRANLIPLALLCGMLLTGFSKAVAQDVELSIILPYSGNFNDWTITFYSRNSSDVFILQTDNSTASSGILGTIPAGQYNVEFNCPYFPWEGFDCGVIGPNFYHFMARNDAFTMYNVPIEEGTGIQIDEGY
jgi:hypothetical protein